ncbi:MAG: hypothetical protein ACKPKO_06780, partial [Candidatus Fonsibacter sp.]
LEVGLTTHNDGHEVLRLRGGGDSSSEEDDKSSEEEEEEAASSEEDTAAAVAAASDDIEITETFEVEFGDGDNSHHMYTNMSGIIITWNTCADDTFKGFATCLAWIRLISTLLTK